LLRFLRALEIPFIASLRDAQAYVHAAGLGEGIFEQPEYKVRADLESWQPLINWLHSPATASAVEQTVTGAVQ
jgi:chromosome partitioning protein